MNFKTLERVPEKLSRTATHDSVARLDPATTPILLQSCMRLVVTRACTNLNFKTLERVPEKLSRSATHDSVAGLDPATTPILLQSCMLKPKNATKLSGTNERRNRYPYLRVPEDATQFGICETK